jgi:transcription termination factor NusA, C-terminal duplication
MVRLDADDELARILVDEGFTSIDEVAYVPVEEMLAIEGFDEELVETLRARARDVLLTSALAGEESREPADDLLAMEGMSPGLAYKLADRGVCTMDELAELSVDELTDIESVDEASAAALIMKAREPWFVDDAEDAEAGEEAKSEQE